MVSPANEPTTVAYLALLGLVGAERLVELWLSRRHAAWAFSRGGIELGQRHFRWMKLLHASLFVACAAEVWALDRPVVPGLAAVMLTLLVASQALRYWAIAALGPYWNVRVIVIPGAPVVQRGPYRFIRHPNYLAVIVEGLALPLVHSAYGTALAFTVLNAGLLVLRIRCEEDALRQHCGYGDSVGARPRFLPTRGRAA